VRLDVRQWNSAMSFPGAASAAPVSPWQRVRRGLGGPFSGLLGFIPGLALALPFSIGISPLGWSIEQFANVGAYVSAHLAAWALARRFSTLTSSASVATWSILTTAAVVIFTIFASRAYYSLSFLGIAFTFSAIWLTIAQHLSSRVIVPTLAVVPGGHVTILNDLPSVRLIPLRRPGIRWLTVDAIVADLHSPHDDPWSRFIIEERLKGRPVLHCADVYERFAQKVSIVHVRDGDLEQIEPPPYVIVKRVIDFAVAALGLVVTAPLLLLAAIAIKVEDRGPVFFSQERVGEQGKVFRMYKLRSMRPDAERDGPQFTSEDDGRTTRIGELLRRCRIDELPQLLNVLRGQMSLIGPRPEQVAFVEHFTQELPFYPARHLVKPGITGWAQVRAGYAADLPETQQKLVHDLYYVKHMSLALDAYIIGRTAMIVATGFGAR